MKRIGKYWRVILALVLAGAALWVFLGVYRPAKADYEAKYARLNSNISLLQSAIAENLRYAGVQEAIPEAEAELEASREALYAKFPQALREEDQIMYVVYLEELFGTEIQFSFGVEEGIAVLSDGTALDGLTLTVNYDTNYEGFKRMVQYLSTDDRITSVRFSSMQYDPTSDRAVGTVTLLRYILNSDPERYVPPQVTTPDTGKVNIFE